MDHRELLDFIGAGRTNTGRRPDWSVNQLQYAGVHFGLSGEDVALRALFKHRIAAGIPCRYADIGCAWPAVISNTYFLYMIGWRGIGIDANPSFAGDWRRVRPQDAFVWGAVTDQTDALFWLENRTNLGASVVQPSRNSASAEYAQGQPVPAVRLDVTFDRYFPNKPIHLMCMDLEGGEVAALRTNDWDRWRPEVIMIESLSFTFDAPTADPAIAFLVEQGYVLADKIGGNVILTYSEIDLNTPSR